MGLGLGVVALRAGVEGVGRESGLSGATHCKNRIPKWEITSWKWTFEAFPSGKWPSQALSWPVCRGERGQQA